MAIGSLVLLSLLYADIKVSLLFRRGGQSFPATEHAKNGTGTIVDQEVTHNVSKQNGYYDGLVRKDKSSDSENVQNMAVHKVVGLRGQNVTKHRKNKSSAILATSVPSSTENGTYVHDSQGQTAENDTTFYDESKDISLQWTIVVQLSGEMGNHLHKIAFGRMLQIRLLEKYAIRTKLVMRHQDRGGKWVRAGRDTIQCFPNLRHYDLSLGNSPEFQTRAYQQRMWLGPQNASRLNLPHLASNDLTNDSLSYFAELVRQSEKNSTVENFELGRANRTISLPFLYVNAFADFSHIDDHYEEYRHLFSLDHAACCRQTAQPDETVFVSFEKKDQFFWNFLFVSRSHQTIFLKIVFFGLLFWHPIALSKLSW